MTDALEEAALSGKLFQPAERSRTPTHSDDDDDISGSESDSEDDQHDQGPSESSSALLPESDEIHQKGAQTGIKGVLNDKKAHTRQNEQRRKEGEKELRKGMERVAIVGNTWKEEEELRSKEGGGEVEEWRRKRLAEMKGGGGMGLREVGREGFVGAVEKEGWVVVLIYEPETARCQTLLSEMTNLSATLASPDAHTRLSTPLTLLRARATTLHFSLLPSSKPPCSHSPREEDQKEDDEDEEVEADPDVLPTMLVYKDGELERNWIRVDWEVGTGSLEGLLRSEGILPVDGFDDRIST